MKGKKTKKKATLVADQLEDQALSADQRLINVKEDQVKKIATRKKKKKKRFQSKIPPQKNLPEFDISPKLNGGD